jgi:hypothetical protein
MLVGMVMFMAIPKPGRRQFIELGIILVISFLTDCIGAIGFHFLHHSTNLANNIFNIINLPIVVLFYRHRIHWRNKNVVAAVIIILFVSSGIVNLFFIQGPFSYNSYTPALASVCFIIISVTYFFVLIQQLPTESITKLPMFWINTAYLIYQSGTFFTYLATDYLINVLRDNLIAYWFIHNLMGLLFYPMLSYACLLIRSEYLQSKVSAN